MLDPCERCDVPIEDIYESEKCQTCNYNERKWFGTEDGCGMPWEQYLIEQAEARMELFG